MKGRQRGFANRDMRAPNSAISLGKSAIELVVRGRSIQVSAAPMLRFLPDPSLVIQFQGLYSGLVHIEQIGPSVKLTPHGIKLDVIPTSLYCGDGEIRGSLVARRQPCTALPTRKRLQSVRFSILRARPKSLL